jgi:hypothetical protein
MLRGTGDEPVRDVQAFNVSLHVQDTEEPQWTNPLTIGAIIQVRPSVRAVVWILRCGPSTTSGRWQFRGGYDTAIWHSLRQSAAPPSS